ncbi:MAG TPA: 30S ribosomal protein S6 [Candidatus Eisenbacteria bacterium]|nr:30S ribosomal protein S6 [Candidatus Eisenbacteria bacterium]
MNGHAKIQSYETLFVVHPERTGRVKEFVEKFRKVIEGLGGNVFHVEEWGLRDLAYRIAKQSRGFYILMRYRASGRAVEELERNMRLTDGVLRYLTVRTEEETATATPGSAKSTPRESPERDPGEATKAEPPS